MDEIPFNSERKMSLLRIKNGGSLTTFVLGAYDILIEKLPANLKAEAAAASYCQPDRGLS